ncbi:MAG: adenylylsulfate reductase subunit alpha, adenylylsulfate reductase, subunit A [Chloroflexi bacterium CSP1-4]|nr:MAG: adenylylsulfate reductase subunit alpha, adenylylsulfate reductase, subunit A [Chloroflexi bacterium CSP1-4]
MNAPEVEVVETDLLILGGGMAGCGAAYEAGYWGRARGLRTTIVEKAAVERSGAVAMGLSAINCYMGMRWGENQPEDFVRYVRQDLMGLCREDLVYDIARHVDASVHQFEEWGLPIFKNEDGRYKREGRWQIMIHGESYKPIVAEAAKGAIGPENVYERIFVSHVLKDPGTGRASGAIGFSVRENKIFVFKARAVISSAGGATGVFRPHAVGEGLGRIWYAPWNTGSAYSLMIKAGATMTQMEHRLVVTRFKDGYGPVGMWFLLFKGKVKNAYGELYEETQAAALDEFPPYGAARPIPTPLRNHQMLRDQAQGRGPHYMRTDEALQARTAGLDPKAIREIESDAWEDFLDMTMSQALLWASNNIDPAVDPSELVLTEPYLMGSHSSATGAWVSGPEDLSPPDYFWGYNRMTTVPGLFAAGDGVGGSAHKFSSGSYAEGRLAAKGAIAYITDNPDRPRVDDEQVQGIVQELFQPYRVFEENQGASTSAAVNPNYFDPKQGLLRLQKVMDEYVAGLSAKYITNEPTLQRGLQLLGLFKEDMGQVAARDRHELLRCWELWDRIWCAEAHARHILFRKETRWPGYYYRGDYPKLDDENWKVFVNSRYDAQTGEWALATEPHHSIVP